LPALGQRAALLRQQMVDQRLELREWTWPAG
jgi:hypothetical protein